MAGWVSAVERLREVASVTPEFDVTNEAEHAALVERTAELSVKYPGIQKFQDYVDFLGYTGGMGAENEGFSMMLFGFGGYIVTSFDEGDFLDQDRYFLFGDITYPSGETIELAFDTQADQDRVLCVHEDSSDYRRCAASFNELLEALADGAYPA